MQTLICARSFICLTLKLKLTMKNFVILTERFYIAPDGTQTLLRTMPEDIQVFNDIYKANVAFADITMKLALRYGGEVKYRSLKDSSPYLCFAELERLDMYVTLRLFEA